LITLLKRSWYCQNRKQKVGNLKTPMGKQESLSKLLLDDELVDSSDNELVDSSEGNFETGAC